MNSNASRNKALILTTYPLVEPRHGGQIRANNLSIALNKAGFDVKTIAYVEAGSKEPMLESDVLFNNHELYDKLDGEYVLFINDLQISKHVSNPDVFKEFCSSINGILDVIIVEQPWLWPLASNYKNKVNPKCIIVYGSQNVESDLKINILKSLTGDTFSHLFSKIKSQIDDIEKRAASECDVLVAVSREELSTISGWTHHKRHILAPNGVEPTEADQHFIEKWRNHLQNRRFLMYVASAHPPNFVQFAELLGESLGAFPPDCRLVIVGSVGEHIYHQVTKGNFSTVNMSRLELLYQIPQEDLAALKVLTSGFLLPIPYGGGTNLKTAEALQTGKPVIGTPEAFRGFESYITASNVNIARTPSEFHNAIRSVFKTKPTMINEISLMPELSWANCFASLTEVLVELTQEKNR